MLFVAFRARDGNLVVLCVDMLLLFDLDWNWLIRLLYFGHIVQTVEKLLHRLVEIRRVPQ